MIIAAAFGMRTYEDLKRAVEQRDGLLLTTMGVLRDIHGAGKLGVHIRRAISESLAGNGMGHLPAELPAYQEDAVRVYRLGSNVATTIRAVLSPSGAGDDALRRSAGSEAQETLKKIRELVCG